MSDDSVPEPVLIFNEDQALTDLCITKCTKLDLKNHITAWNALKKIGKPHDEMLKRMGYSTTQ